MWFHTVENMKQVFKLSIWANSKLCKNLLQDVLSFFSQRQQCMPKVNGIANSTLWKTHMKRRIIYNLNYLWAPYYCLHKVVPANGLRGWIKWLQIDEKSVEGKLKGTHLVKAKKPSFLNSTQSQGSVWRFLEVIMFDKSLSSLCRMTVLGRSIFARQQLSPSLTSQRMKSLLAFTVSER